MVLSNSLVLLLSGGGLIYRATAANCGAALGGVLCSEPSHCCSEYGYCGIGDESDHDTGGGWSDLVQGEVMQTTGCSSSATTVPHTTTTSTAGTTTQVATTTTTTATATVGTTTTTPQCIPRGINPGSASCDACCSGKCKVNATMSLRSPELKATLTIRYASSNVNCIQNSPLRLAHEVTLGGPSPDL
ncbi:predicted protein [Thalassiosira pseudonana CCMP1335]|uniref:Chitin-binding type-1 domain-containing protein n=1 Tax=Thalassiosira pseudonana TaxID=35128 RepID=B8C873_THAPS|nr:predicted protein [Thalassiosira pseudonana CCMP1335]EED90437.1 predicted protein [Thalassiosira pseudonana CCMP1335]